jgi:hypothetical protein
LCCFTENVHTFPRPLGVFSSSSHLH